MCLSFHGSILSRSGASKKPGAVQGVAIQDWHPSFALLAYVASIETIGEKLSKPKRCPQCNQVLGSMSRFRQALVKVRSDDEANGTGQWADAGLII